MDPLLIPFDDRAGLARALAGALHGAVCAIETRRFPDGETYVRLMSDARDRDVVIVGSLDRPDEKLVPIYLIASTARAMGARRVVLAAPYLAYLRQDTAFHPGESVSAHHFAALLSRFLDGIATIDPHLHRIASLEDIFRIPVVATSAVDAISAWIATHVPDALIIGPDSESAQWVARIAGLTKRPYRTLSKARHGDRDVAIGFDDVLDDGGNTPVLVDDIISTARTMIAAVDAARRRARHAPVCIGVHPIFAGNAYAELQQRGPAAIVSCNSIAHESNRIDIAPAMADAVATLLERRQP